MEPKKSPKADLQGKRGLFLEIGLFVAIGLMILAFNWSQTTQIVPLIETQTAVVEQEMIEITREPPKVTQPRANISFQSDEIRIVKDDIKILVDPDFAELDEDRPLIIPDGTNGPGSGGDGEPPVFLSVEDDPKFQGGDFNKFREWVSRQISNNYPPEARRQGIQGVVMVYFVIDDKGQLGRINVINSPSPILSNALIKVLQSSPKWTPGKQGRKAVMVGYNMPVNFELY